MKKVMLFYELFNIMFRMAKLVDSKLIGVAAGDSLGIKHVWKIHFFGGFPKGRKTKTVTSCDNVFLTNIMLAWSRATDARPARTEITLIIRI